MDRKTTPTTSSSSTTTPTPTNTTTTTTTTTNVVSGQIMVLVSSGVPAGYSGWKLTVWMLGCFRSRMSCCQDKWPFYPNLLRCNKVTDSLEPRTKQLRAQKLSSKLCTKSLETWGERWHSLSLPGSGCKCFGNDMLSSLTALFLCLI